MANSDKNILITPSVGLSTNPTIRFNGANNTPTTLRVLDDGTISFEGTAGQLFSISDGLSGSIFSVNDISGIPSIEVLDTGLVKLNQYGGSTVFGASAAIQNSSLVNAKVSISTASASTPGLIVKGAASQTANLQEWQDSAGTGLSSINSAGRLFVNTTTNYFASIQAVAYTAGAHALRIVGHPVGTVGPGRIGAGAAGQVPLTIEGFASQTANLTEWHNSAGTVLSRITSSGQLSVPNIYSVNGSGAFITMNSASGAVNINTNTAANIGLIIGATASQTANLTEWRDSAGTVLAKVNATGKFIVVGDNLNNFQSTGASSTLYNGFTVNTNTNAANYVMGTAGASETAFGVANSFYIYDGIVGSMRLRINSSGLVGINAIPTSQLHVINSNASNVGLIVKGAASQTGNLQEWQDNSGNILLSVSGSSANMDVRTIGNFYLRTSNNNSINIQPYVSAGSPVATFNFNSIIFRNHAPITAESASSQGLIVKGASSQTANLQEWQNSAGTVLSRIDGAGSLISETVRASVLRAGNWASLPSGTVAAFSTCTTASTVGFIVKGATSQTANLQEWQDSGGTVLASISNTGNITLASNLGINMSGANAGIYGFGGEWGVYREGADFKVNAPISLYLQSVYGGGTLFASMPTKITNSTAASVGLIVKAAASQTANLQEWQNSAGSVLGYINSNGHLNINELNGATSLQYGNSFGVLQTKRGIIALAGVSNNPAISIFGADSPTADLMTWGKSNGDIIGGITANAGIYTNLQSASQVGLIVKGAASQTADLQQWQDSTGAVITKVNSIGRMTINSSSDAGGAALYVIQPNGGYGVRVLGAGTSGAALWVDTVAGGVGAIIRGAASQTADLQQWQNSAGTVLARVDAYGHVKTDGYVQVGLNNGIVVGGVFVIRVNYSSNNSINIGDNAAQQSAAQVQVTNSVAGKVGLIVKAAASQSADLQQWQDSSGNVLAKIQSTGAFNTSWAGSFGTLSNLSSTTLGVVALNSTIVPLVAKGAASQTADLQQWQNSSSTVLAKVDKDGNINTTKSFVQTGTIGTTYAIDASGNQEAYAANATVDFPNFSGMILIDCQTDGALSLWLCGGAAATRIGGSKTGGYDGNVAYNSGINGYTWTNANTSQNVNITAIRARSGA